MRKVNTMDNVPEQFIQRNYTKSYNKWHWESCPKNIYMMDLDCLEIRGNKIVALIETRTTQTPLNDWQKRIVLQVADSLNVPAFLTSHNEALSEFRVTNLRTDETKILKEFDYIEFLQNL